MKMKTIIVIGWVLAVAATVSVQAQQVQLQQGPGDDYWLRLDGLELSLPIQGKVVKGMPYAAEIVNESLRTLSDGNRIVHRSTARVYRDSEGRVRREEDTASANPTITITDPVANKSYTLDPPTRTARETTGLRLYANLSERLNTLQAYLMPGKTSKSGITTSGVGRGGRGTGRGAARGADEAPVEEQLPNRNIEGVVASGIRRTTTIPQGAIGNEQPIKIVSEEWTSVDLQVLVLTDMNDPRTGRTTYKLLNINRASPDPALFKVPSDYTVQAFGRGRGGRGN